MCTVFMVQTVYQLCERVLRSVGLDNTADGHVVLQAARHILGLIWSSYLCRLSNYREGQTLTVVVYLGSLVHRAVVLGLYF